LGLLLASRKPQISGVVGTAPSSVVWQGIPKTFWPPRSSWSLGGQPVPFVPYDSSKGFSLNDIFGLYKQSLSQKEPVQKASIEVEKINGPILLLSGVQDTLWPSAEMGDMICQRLKEKEFKYRYEHVKYPDAGHTLNEYYMLGGNYDGNKQARLESTKKIAEFLKVIEAE
jgi:pimeloyl-ACP methyl ester carboxylesterase